MDLDYERDGSLARRRDMDTADRPGAHVDTADHGSSVVGKLTANQKIRLRKKKNKTGTIEDTSATHTD